jgi:hypothetical protein
VSVLGLAPEPTVPLARVPDRRFRVPAWLAPAGSVLGGTALIGWHAAKYGNWIVDDAAITFSYARSLTDGAGPVLQPGQPPVEGYSNPAWLVLLAAGRLLGLFDRGTIFGIPDYVLYPKALSLLACVGILLLTYRAAARISRRPWLVTLAVGAGLAAIPSFVIWMFSGLENPLYAFAVVWLAVTLFLAVLDDRSRARRTAILVGLIAALAALTRPDGLIYVAAYPIVVLSQSSRPRLWASARSVALSLAAFAVPVGGYLAFRLAEFGRLTAMTAVAKNQAAPELSDLDRVGELVLYTGALLVLVLAFMLGMVAPRRGFSALLVPLALALVAYAVLEADWMGQLRFATPVWALGVPACGIGAAQVFGRGSARIRVLLVLALAVALLPPALRWLGDARQFRASPTVPMCAVADRMGRMTNGYADLLGIEEGTLLIPDIGGAALTSRLTIVDFAGLAEARIAHYWADANAPGLRDYIFDEVRPSIVHTHGHWSNASGLLTDPRLDRDYHLIYTDPADPLSGDYVRKSLVPNQSRLDTVRAYAATTLPGLPAAPRGHCGPTLRRGQVPAIARR